MKILSSNAGINIKSFTTDQPIKTGSIDSALPEPVSDYQFLNNIRPDQAREFLLNQINREFNISQQTTISDSAVYAPNNTANTALKVRTSISQALNSNNKLTTETLLKKINDSFNETKAILKNMNINQSSYLPEFDAIQKNAYSYIATTLSQNA